MLRSVGSDLNKIIHVNVFLDDMQDIDEMNRRMMLEWLKGRANKPFEYRRENADAFPAFQLNVML